jgi:DNA-binding NarL/FixJ family response regulator
VQLFEQPIQCPIVVGREAELDALTRTIQQVAAGHNCTVLLSGEAGIGKSRLVAEARSAVTSLGWRILAGACFETDRALPYAPLLDLLRAHVARLTPAEAVVALGADARDLATVLPELTHQLPEHVPESRLDPVPDHRVVSRAIAGLALRQPTLLIVEDLHWSDDASLDTLLQLARSAAEARTLLLLTYRDDEVGPALSHFLAALDRQRLATELPLQRLNPRDVGAMARALRAEGTWAHAGAFPDALHALTDGNPFFIEEVLTTLQGDQTLDPLDLNPARIPRSVHDAVRRRARRLTSAARRVLDIAAVAGRRCDFALLHALTGLDEPELLQLVKELIGAQLLVEEAGDRFAFRHALTQHAIASSLLTRERRQLHQAVVVELERLYGDADDSRLAELAYHADAAGDWPRALDYATRAAAQAQARYAPRAAVEQYSRAVGAARQLGRAPEPGLHRERGQAFETLGDFDGALTDYETALDSARTAHDQRSMWRALLDLGLLWAERDYARSDAYCRQALDLARALSDPVTLAQSLNRVGNVHTNAARPRDALPYHLEALSILEARDDARGRAETLDLLGVAHYVGGHPAESAAYYRAAAERYRALDDRRGLAWCLSTLALCGGNYQTDAGAPAPMDPDEPLTNVEIALQVARDIDWRPGEAYARQVLGTVSCARGRYDHALGAFRAGITVAEAIEHQQWLVAGLSGLGALYVDLLAPVKARQCLEAAVTSAHAMSSRLWVLAAAPMLAEACLLTGDLAAAQSVLDAADLPDIPDAGQGGRSGWLARAELSLARGDAAHALSVADSLIATDPQAAGAQRAPRLALLRGTALARLSRLDEAEAALQAAVAGADGARRPALRWRALLALGRLCRAQRRHAEAETAFADARSIVADLAASVPERAVREMFLTATAALLPAPRRLTPRRAAQRAFGGLTAREREVATLVARGQPNRAIADALIISEPTVATHISHILTKLDFTSRAQIAAWAVEVGLAGVAAQPPQTSAPLDAKHHQS